MRPDLDRGLSGRSLEVLQALGAVAAERRQGIWLVGGPVRDLLLGTTGDDLDVVVEGDGLGFARTAAERLGGGVTHYARFLTATLTLPDMVRVDVATARVETYARAAALPEVKPGTIDADLFRRDFTINAMALSLRPDRFGELLDPFGGAADLEAGRLKVLHAKSFVDDPTRILRMARFAGRLGFAPDEATAARLAEALAGHLFDFLTADRLREEILHLLHESDPAAAFARLADWGVLPVILPGALPDGIFAAEMALLKPLLAYVERGSAWDPALTGLLLLVRRALPDQLAQVGTRLNLAPAAKAQVARAGGLADLAGKAAAAKGSGLRLLLGGLPLESLLAVLVLTEGEPARERIFEWIRGVRQRKPELTGDDLQAMGFEPGPKLGLILAALQRALDDGDVEGRKAEEAFVRARFAAPAGDALS